MLANRTRAVRRAGEHSDLRRDRIAEAEARVDLHVARVVEVDREVRGRRERQLRVVLDLVAAPEVEVTGHEVAARYPERTGVADAGVDLVRHAVCAGEVNRIDRRGTTSSS